MQAPVVRVNLAAGEYMYGVLLEEASMIIAWDGPNEPWVMPFEAFPTYELVREEVEVPSDLAETARSYQSSRRTLIAAYPELIGSRRLREAAAAAGFPYTEDRLG